MTQAVALTRKVIALRIERRELVRKRDAAEGRIDALDSPSCSRVEIALENTDASDRVMAPPKRSREPRVP